MVAKNPLMGIDEDFLAEYIRQRTSSLVIKIDKYGHDHVAMPASQLAAIQRLIAVLLPQQIDVAVMAMAKFQQECQECPPYFVMVAQESRPQLIEAVVQVTLKSFLEAVEAGLLDPPAPGETSQQRLDRMIKETCQVLL